jgi:cytochrome P450
MLQREFTQIILSTSQNHSTGSDGPKTLVALAVKQYVEAGEAIPEDVLDSIVQNIKIFLVAGHETTGTTLTRLLYFLSVYSDKLTLVRAEHDAVLGHDPDTAAEAILANYSILNKLTYTIAAIKETLRLFPPVSGSVREAKSPDFELVNRENGKHFPTHGFILNPSALTMSSDERFWYKPLDFIPERFLVQDEKDPLYPHKNAFQPLSLGPRICIGQVSSQSLIPRLALDII